MEWIETSELQLSSRFYIRSGSSGNYIYKRGDGSNNCCPFLSGWLMRISSSTIRGLESDVEQEKPQYSVQKKDPESLSSNIHYLQVLPGLSRWPWKPELAIPGGLVIPWSSPLVPHFQTRIQRSQEWAAVDRKATSDVAVANILLPITYGVALYRSRFMAPLGVVKKLVVYNFEFWSFQFPGSFHGSFYHFSMKPVFFLQKKQWFFEFSGHHGPWSWDSRSMEVDPLLLMLPVGLACSLPFMLLGSDVSSPGGDTRYTRYTREKPPW